MSRIVVLVAEDDTDVREWLLSELGAINDVAMVCAVKDGATLQAKLVQGGVDLVVSDIAMPAKSGLDAAKAARASGDTTPFLFITGFDTRPLQEKVKAIGQAAVLQKPFSARELIDQATQLLGRTELSRRG